MKLRILSAAIALIIVSLGWFAVRTHGARLEFALAVAREQHAELARLTAEQNRLRAQAPDPIQFSADRRAEAEAIRLQREIDDRRAAPRPAPFSLGHWTPPASWENRGTSAPLAALETALWAAAGGDVDALTSVLELDEVAQARSHALLATLPVGARAAFPTTAALVASLTLGRIPVAESQVAWFHESDPDHAVVGLLLHGAKNFPRAQPDDSGATGERPPMLSESPSTRLTTLSLHRTAGGWRLVVPSSAIDRMGKDLLADAK